MYTGEGKTLVATLPAYLNGLTGGWHPARFSTPNLFVQHRRGSHHPLQSNDPSDTGKGVYVCTVNDYLAKRDFEQMSPVLIALGLTVGLVSGDLQTASPERRNAYHCDVTYCTGQV